MSDIKKLQAMASELNHIVGLTDYVRDGLMTKLIDRLRIAEAERDAALLRVAELTAALEIAKRRIGDVEELPERGHLGSCVLGITDCDGDCMAFASVADFNGDVRKIDAALADPQPERAQALADALQFVRDVAAMGRTLADGGDRQAWATVYAAQDIVQRLAALDGCVG